MQLFFVPEITETFTIEGEEARHLSKVLRKKAGDAIQVTDGKGKGFAAEIISVFKDEICARVTEEMDSSVELKSKIHLWVAPTKNADRYEWMVEKAVELGVVAITPVICERSERKNCNTERLRKIALAAMKQSGRFVLPEIYEAVKLNQADVKEEQKLVAHCMDSHKMEITEVKLDSGAAILIGPEGDFTGKEVEYLIHQNWIPVSLGKSRLRTETAAVYAISAVRSKE